MKFIIILLLTITSFSQNKLYSIETQLKQLFEEILDSLEINENNNKCKNDLINQKFTILKIIQELINEIKTGKNISKAISVEFLNYLLLMVYYLIADYYISFLNVNQ